MATQYPGAICLLIRDKGAVASRAAYSRSTRGPGDGSGSQNQGRRRFPVVDVAVGSSSYQSCCCLRVKAVGSGGGRRKQESEE